MADPTKKELLEQILKLAKAVEGVEDREKELPAPTGKMTRGQKIEKGTNWATVVSAVVVGLLSYYNGEDAQQQAKMATVEAAKEEKAEISYEIIMGALKDQQEDIRELRTENRALRREVHEMALFHQSEPMAMVAEGVGEEDDEEVAEPMGPPKPAVTDNLPKKLDDHPRVKKMMQRRQEQLQIQQVL
jgi:hypothetical protein